MPSAVLSRACAKSPLAFYVAGAVRDEVALIKVARIINAITTSRARCSR